MSKIKTNISVVCFDRDTYDLDMLNGCNDKQLSEMALADGENAMVYDTLERFQNDMNCEGNALPLYEYNYVFYLDNTTY